MIAGHWQRGRWFIAALLLALASALVPALCFPGLPTARAAAGSAFDPETSTVALRGRAKAVARADVIHPDDGSAGKAQPARIDKTIEVATLRAEPLNALSHPATRTEFLPAPRDTLRRVTRAQPRAPPFQAA